MKPEGLLGTAPAMMQAMPGMVPPGMIPQGLHGMPPGLSMGPVMQMGPMGPQFLHPGYVFDSLLRFGVVCVCKIGVCTQFFNYFCFYHFKRSVIFITYKYFIL